MGSMAPPIVSWPQWHPLYAVLVRHAIMAQGKLWYLVKDRHVLLPFVLQVPKEANVYMMIFKSHRTSIETVSSWLRYLYQMKLMELRA
jgi:hypothetical protein